MVGENSTTEDTEDTEKKDVNAGGGGWARTIDLGVMNPTL
jgi:hypothetical protein